MAREGRECNTSTAAASTLNVLSNGLVRLAVRLSYIHEYVHGATGWRTEL